MDQYYRSVILLDKNGIFPRRKKTKQINIIYYVIKYRVEKVKLEVEYCSIEKC